MSTVPAAMAPNRVSRAEALEELELEVRTAGPDRCSKSLLFVSLAAELGPAALFDQGIR